MTINLKLVSLLSIVGVGQALNEILKKFVWELESKLLNVLIFKWSRPCHNIHQPSASDLVWLQSMMILNRAGSNTNGSSNHCISIHAKCQVNTQAWILHGINHYYDNNHFDQIAMTNKPYWDIIIIVQAHHLIISFY